MWDLTCPWCPSWAGSSPSGRPPWVWPPLAGGRQRPRSLPCPGPSAGKHQVRKMWLKVFNSELEYLPSYCGAKYPGWEIVESLQSPSDSSFPSRPSPLQLRRHDYIGQSSTPRSAVWGSEQFRNLTFILCYFGRLLMGLLSRQTECNSQFKCWVFSSF